ncbi:hypothetical protein HK101_001552 [Irineochytrium annulatum]|nr:hypothetical protein HK101_001552 [Irineochytrium annulatum]
MAATNSSQHTLVADNNSPLATGIASAQIPPSNRSPTAGNDDPDSFFDYPKTDSQRHQAFQHLSSNGTDVSLDPAVAVMLESDGITSGSGKNDVPPHQLIYDKHGSVLIDPATGLPLAIAAPPEWSVAHGEGASEAADASRGDPERVIERKGIFGRLRMQVGGSRRGVGGLGMEEGGLGMVGGDKRGAGVAGESVWKVWKWQRRNQIIALFLLLLLFVVIIVAGVVGAKHGGADSGSGGSSGNAAASTTAPTAATTTEAATDPAADPRAKPTPGGKPTPSPKPGKGRR